MESKNTKNKKVQQQNIVEDCDTEGCSAITFAEQRKIIKTIKDTKYLNFFIFCCCTGMRVSEALSIKTKDINKRKKVIKITMPDSKTKKHKREIPYCTQLFKNMDTSQDYLFNDITEDGSKQYFYKLYKSLGLDLSRHSTRHTFVSVCTHVGIQPETIQKWAGHTDLKMTTNTYTHKLRNGVSPIHDYVKQLKNQNKTTN